MQNPLGVSTVGLRVCEDTCMLCVQGQSDAKCPSEEAPVCPRPTRQSQGCAPLPEQRLPPLCRLSAGKWQHHCLGPQQGRPAWRLRCHRPRFGPFPRCGGYREGQMGRASATYDGALRRAVQTGRNSAVQEFVAIPALEHAPIDRAQSVDSQRRIDILCRCSSASVPLLDISGYFAGSLTSQINKERF